MKQDHHNRKNSQKNHIYKKVIEYRKRGKDNYMFAGDFKLLELQSASNKKLLKVTNLIFKLLDMGFYPISNPLEKFRYPNFDCNNNIILLLY